MHQIHSTAPVKLLHLTALKNLKGEVVARIITPGPLLFEEEPLVADPRQLAERMALLEEYFDDLLASGVVGDEPRAQITLLAAVVDDLARRLEAMERRLNDRDQR